MCGIAGIINFGGQPVDVSELETINNVLAHRGPDGEGIYCQDNIGLAHHRLAIIDPQAGVQPFGNDDNGLVAKVWGVWMFDLWMQGVHLNV